MSDDLIRAPGALCAIPRGLAPQLDHGRELGDQVLELVLEDMEREDLALEDLAALELIVDQVLEDPELAP